MLARMLCLQIVRGDVRDMLVRGEVEETLFKLV